MKAYKFFILFLVIAFTYSFAQFTNVAVTTNSYDQSETTIAISPLNSNNTLAAWNDFRVINGNGYSKAGYAFSTNNGTTWSEKILVPPTGYLNGFDPSVAYDRYGNSFYCYVAYLIGPIGNIYVSRTTNLNNVDWPDQIVSENNHYNDKPFMAVDNTGGSKDGRIYVSWTDFSGYSSAIKFSYSTDHGVNFSTPITFSSNPLNPGLGAQLMPRNTIPENPTAGFVQGSMPTVGPNGEVYIIWAEVTNGGVYNGGAFKIKKSTDGGISFGATSTVCQFTPRAYSIGTPAQLDIRTYLPSMATDPTTGYIYVAFTDQASQSNTNARVKFVRSTDCGISWSNPSTLADFGIGWQVMPWVCADKNGRVSILFINSSDLTSVDSYLIESFNNGLSFYSPLRVSSQSSNPANSLWSHHYMGAANINGGDSYCIWTDYRGGNADPNFSLANSMYYYATQNKSINYDATFSNNSHIIERGYFGKLYEVFHSGGEIFYRRSSNNGTSWEITKRITSGNSSNTNPSIVAGVSSADVLRLVWQRKLDNTHYEIWYSYSTNSGTDWSAPAIVSGSSNVTVSYYQSNPGAGPGPTPVVASFYRGGSEGTPSFILVYADQNGLRYRLANDNNLSWTIPANDIVPGSNLSSIVWYPCLASYNSQGYNVNLIYDDRFAHVYSQIYNEDGTWTNRIIADGAGTYNRMSSVALDYTNNTLGVWCGWNGSNYVIRFRQGFANGTWSSWSKEWSTAGTNSFCPVITYYNKGGSYPYGIDILWYNTLNQIRQKKYYGLGDNWIPADPNTQLLYSNGLFPNITHERQNTTIPKQIHTDQTAQPYSLMDNSLNLPKENLIIGSANYRAAEITDTLSNSNFRIELKEPVIALTTGEKIVLPFKEYNYQDTLDLSTENVFNYLQTKQSNIPNTAKSITFKINIAASQPDTNSRGSLNTNKATPFKNVVFKLLAKDNSLNTLLNNIEPTTLNNPNGIYNQSKEFTINVQALRNKNVFIIPDIAISGTFNQNNLQFSLVNISVEENSFAKDSTEIIKSLVKPTGYTLEQNFPNPFNPVTQIKYSIVDNGIVTLKIYDVLGREIATLVNEEKTAGNYEVSFDASQLSSGIYLYTIQVGRFTQTRKMVLLK
ncbi:MAG TPA: T9SS type A sorting domain-containing protein [Ignavibacteriaceae bacterium]|nr:T9SS type A sorting domain-containing protein [Ignavibacteriaceae bacterium]HRP93979.1 T9SS type A sorting domain-containing protein [Ignavibacteriaceae bacterium]